MDIGPKRTLGNDFVWIRKVDDRLTERSRLVNPWSWAKVVGNAPDMPASISEIDETLPPRHLVPFQLMHTFVGWSQLLVTPNGSLKLLSFFIDNRVAASAACVCGGGGAGFWAEIRTKTAETWIDRRRQRTTRDECVACEVKLDLHVRKYRMSAMMKTREFASDAQWRVLSKAREYAGDVH